MDQQIKSMDLHPEIYSRLGMQLEKRLWYRLELIFRPRALRVWIVAPIREQLQREFENEP
jgi:hypothetical protein